MNAKINLVIFSVLALSSLATSASSFSCTKIPPDSRFWKSQSKDSLSFQKLYDINYKKQEARIKSFSSKVAHPDKARELFFDETTKFGRDNNQLNQTELADLKTKFGYDSVAQLMFDSADLIKPPAHYDRVIISENETLYVKNDRIIARLEKLNSEFILSRFNSNCEPIDFSIIGDLNPQSDSAIQAKISKNFCRDQNVLSSKQVEAEKIEKLNSFILGQESNEIESALWDKVTTQCQRLFPAVNSKSKSLSKQPQGSN